MKGSGITRRIDELGRIVIPKEIRYNLGIREGEPLEIYIEDYSIIIKKFSQIENIKEISSNICNIISEICNVDVLISDREKIIACSSKLKSLEDAHLTEKHKSLIDERMSYSSTSKEKMYDIYNYFTIFPIITTNDSCGLIFIISSDNNFSNLKYAKIASRLIVQKIDIAS